MVTVRKKGKNTIKEKMKFSFFIKIYGLNAGFLLHPSVLYIFGVGGQGSG